MRPLARNRRARSCERRPNNLGGGDSHPSSSSATKHFCVAEGRKRQRRGHRGQNHMLSARKLPTSRSSRLSSDPRIPLPLPKTLPRAGESGWQFSPLLLVLAEVSVEGLAVPVGLGLCFGRVTHDNIWRNFCSTRNCFFWYWNQNCRRPVLTQSQTRAKNQRGGA